MIALHTSSKYTQGPSGASLSSLLGGRIHHFFLEHLQYIETMQAYLQANKGVTFGLVKEVLTREYSDACTDIKPMDIEAVNSSPSKRRNYKNRQTDSSWRILRSQTSESIPSEASTLFEANMIT